MLRGALPESLQIRSAAAAEDTRRMFDRTQEAQRAMRALSSPVAPPTAKSGEAPAPAYKPAERRDMDRLIDSTR